MNGFEHLGLSSEFQKVNNKHELILLLISDLNLKLILVKYYLKNIIEVISGRCINSLAAIFQISSAFKNFRVRHV